MLKCGNRRKAVLTRRCGITREQRENLEATVKGSIGLKGIAELKSEIAGKSGIRIEFDESTETSEKFVFSAPACGRLDLTSYQLQKVYRLQYDDRRLWHKDHWTRNILEWVDQLYDDSRKYNYDPDCRCPRKKESEMDGKIVLEIEDKLAMNTPFSRTEGEFRLSELDLSLSEGQFNRMLRGDFEVNSDLLPPHLLFLAGIEGETVSVRIAPGVPHRTFADGFDELGGRRQPEVVGKRGSGFGYLVGGACVGVGLGLLFAPKRSSETHDYARRKARELRERADELIEKSKGVAREKGSAAHASAAEQKKVESESESL